MPGRVAHCQEQVDAGSVIRDLHGLVTYGPGDLEIAWAMSQHGYDATKWAEGQGMLAELVSCEQPVADSVAQAIGWYREAATTAMRALSRQPQLLAKMGLDRRGSE
jgi:hypothetical protein